MYIYLATKLGRITLRSEDLCCLQGLLHTYTFIYFPCIMYRYEYHRFGNSHNSINYAKKSISIACPEGQLSGYLNIHR